MHLINILIYSLSFNHLELYIRIWGKIQKIFTIAYEDNNDYFCKICEYAERSNEATKNAINNIPIFKKIKIIYLDSLMRVI